MSKVPDGSTLRSPPGAWVAVLISLAASFTGISCDGPSTGEGPIESLSPTAQPDFASLGASEYASLFRRAITTVIQDRIARESTVPDHVILDVASSAERFDEDRPAFLSLAHVRDAFEQLGRVSPPTQTWREGDRNHLDEGGTVLLRVHGREGSSRDRNETGAFAIGVRATHSRVASQELGSEGHAMSFRWADGGWELVEHLVVQQ